MCQRDALWKSTYPPAPGGPTPSRGTAEISVVWLGILPHLIMEPVFNRSLTVAPRRSTLSTHHRGKRSSLDIEPHFREGWTHSTSVHGEITGQPAMAQSGQRLHCPADSYCLVSPFGGDSLGEMWQDLTKHGDQNSQDTAVCVTLLLLLSF